MNPKYIVIIIAIIIIGLAVFLGVYFGLHRNEHYKVAKDDASKQMFDKLTADLAKIYPHDLSKIDMKGLVSCIPEDSYTENKKHVCICLRNKQGTFLPYSKMLKIGIHELAHVMSKQHDPEHKTPEFIGNYASLMNKAKELGFQVE